MYGPHRTRYSSKMVSGSPNVVCLEHVVRIIQERQNDQVMYSSQQYVQNVSAGVKIFITEKV